jgi:uncharacterized RDD family membrane protein YckC
LYCTHCGLLQPNNGLHCVSCGQAFAVSAAPQFSAPLSLHLPLASLTERVLGQLLDSLIAIGAVCLSALLFLVSNEAGVLSMLGGLAFAVFYILFADGLSNGQSYGKKVLNTAVVDASTGAPCTFWSSFLRNLLLSLLGIIDWVFIFGRRRQRLGDMAANTVVIKRPMFL